MRNFAKKRRKSTFFRAEAVPIPSSRGFQVDHDSPKERQLQKGCNAPLLRCNRIGCPSETASQYHKQESCTSIRPSFPQKALHTFKIFTKSQPYLRTPAPWDECLEKETSVDFFRDEAVTIPSSRGLQTDHDFPKERQLPKGCNASLLRCNRLGCPSETTSQ